MTVWKNRVWLNVAMGMTLVVLALVPLGASSQWVRATPAEGVVEGTTGLLGLEVDGAVQSVDTAADLMNFDSVALLDARAGAATPWWQSHTVLGADGRVHTTFYTSDYIFYATCGANCNKLANWTITPVAETGNYSSLAYPSLALDPAGHPRIVRYDDDLYFYMQCNTNCTKASNWTTVQIPIPEDTWNIQSNHTRYFALDGSGRPRVVASYYSGLLYASCDVSCMNAANWQVTLLELGERVAYPQLAVTSSGQPRVVGTGQDLQLDYLQCNSGCTQPANWHRVRLARNVRLTDLVSSYALKLDGQDRPRVAFYKMTGNEITYAWSNANATSAAGWASYTLSAPPADDRTVDLAFDSQGRPRMVYGSENFDLIYLECTANCHSTSGTSQWLAYEAETGETLQERAPIPTLSGCWGSDWWITGYASLALDADDLPYISHHAQHVQYCGNSTTALADAWAIRLVGPGAGSAVLKHKAYIPLALR
jgi:hypothetical protein